ncbi:MAG: hypothetical protein HFH35_07630 [Eubacterium sp.]|nr:hypothetical protein [Eubacterium sp.]
MDLFEGIKKRTEADSLLRYIESGTCKFTIEDLYHMQVDEEFERLIQKISTALCIDCKNNSEICDAAEDFYGVCQELYFKAGLVSGFQICKNLGNEYRNIKEDDAIRFIIKKLTAELDKKSMK